MSTTDEELSYLERYVDSLVDGIHERHHEWEDCVPRAYEPMLEAPLEITAGRCVTLAWTVGGPTVHSYAPIEYDGRCYFVLFVASWGSRRIYRVVTDYEVCETHGLYAEFADFGH